MRKIIPIPPSSESSKPSRSESYKVRIPDSEREKLFIIRDLGPSFRKMKGKNRPKKTAPSWSGKSITLKVTETKISVSGEPKFWVLRNFGPPSLQGKKLGIHKGPKLHLKTWFRSERPISSQNRRSYASRSSTPRPPEINWDPPPVESVFENMDDHPELNGSLWEEYH